MDTSKIIKGVVNSGRYTVTAPIVKENYGIYLQIEGVELPETYQVDFSNDEHHGTSVTMIGNADGVRIPRQFIDTGKDVFAFLYWVGEDYGKTVYKFRIPNKLRPDRTNEEPTPEEQSVIDQAISALNTAVEQTAQDVIDADASAQSASQSAENAHNSAVDAQNYAESAQTSATQASASASQASASASASANSASQSAQIKADVEELADDAQGYADSARQSASQASASEQGCARAVLDAASAAAIARARADEASGYAQTASAKAQDASTSAQTASTKATEASQSASQALTYKTDAESAKTASQTAQGLAESARDSAIQAKTDAESARDEAQNLVDGISGKVEQIDANTERIESLEDDRYKPYVVDSASGSIASFSDGADGIPLKSLVVDIDPVQDTSSGDPSPTNICPISGWMECDVVQTGKNLLKMPSYAEIISAPYVASYRSVAIKLEPNTTYYISTNFLNGYTPTGTGLIVLVSNNATSNNPWKAIAHNGREDGKLDGALTTHEDGMLYLRFNGVGYTSAKIDTLYANSKIQLEKGDSATSYEPFGRFIPINWEDEAGTVYGGKLDVLRGILTVYPEYDSYNGETLTGRWISDRDVYAVGTTPTIGAQVVNIGAEGTEIQLEPHEIASLLGQNNIFADTGDTACEYRADTKLYINRLTEPDADMVADSNITSGQYFMVGNNLFKATANIANGGQIIVGTNCTRKSLSEALNEINA